MAERTKIGLMLLIVVFLAVISKSNCQFRMRPAPVQNRPTPVQNRPAPVPVRPMPVPTPAFPNLRPLCISQFALVNHACSMLPYTPASPSHPSSPPPPPSPTPALESPCPARRDASHRHGHHHRHRHSSSSRGSHPSSMVEEECCRWLKEVDSQCVCDLLVRLPVFLSKPGHDYTVIVNHDCSVTYNCPGRVIV